MEKTIRCPQCGLEVRDPALTRCPRCNQLLLRLVGCDGACSRCVKTCGVRKPSA